MKKKFFALITLGVLFAPLSFAASTGEGVKPMDSISYGGAIRCGDEYAVKQLNESGKSADRGAKSSDSTLGR